MVNNTRQMPKRSPVEQRAPDRIQFSIADILIATTLIGVVLGAATISPPLSVGLFGLVFAALLRTLIVRAFYGTQQGDGELTSFWIEFLASIAIVFWSGLLGGAILFAGLVVGHALDRNNSAMWPILLSLVVAAIVAGAIFWTTRNVTGRSF